MKTKKITAILISLILFCNAILICVPTAFAAKKIIYVNVDKDKIDYELPVMVSLGDSYSSGEGNEHFYDYDKPFSDRVNSSAWLAHRSENSWPGKLVLTAKDGSKIKMSDYRGKNWIFAASSGAVTWNLYDGHEQEKTASQIKSLTGNAFSDFDIKTQYLAPQLEVFKSLKKDSVDYVTMTMGGNDAGFTDVITSALVLRNRYFDPNCFSAFLQLKINNFNKSDGIRSHLETAYKQIAEAAGSQAHIIIAGYPNLLEPTGKTIVFSSFEANEIKKAVNYFNSGICDLVESLSDGDMKIHFVSVMDETKDYNFCGHEAYSNKPYINEIKITQKEDINALSPVSAYSIHPNEEGIKVYAHCVQEEINRIEKEKGNNTEPLVVEVDDDQGSNFKSGKYLVNIDNTIIGAKSDGIYYKENVTSNEKKISNTGNVICLLSDGETVYYAEGYDDYADIDKRFTSKKIYKTSINDSKSEYIFSSNGQADLITCQNGCLYYLDITQSGNEYKYSLMKRKIGASDSTKLVGEWSADLPSYWKDTAYCLGNTIFLTVNNSLCSYNIGDDKYNELISASDGNICDIIDNKVCFRYSKGESYYIAMIDANSNVETSVPISKKYDYQIVAQSGEYALFSSKMGSSEYNLYTINLKTGKIDVSEGDAGGFLGKNYFVAHDLVKPENLYFMYGVKLYDENSKSLKQMKSDDFEINITKPMWIIDGYIVDWNLNTYKIYDDTVDSSNTNKNILSQNESWKTLYIDHINSMNEVYEDIYIAYIDDDDIPELYVRGKYHMAGAALCWIDDGEVKFQACAQNFGFKEKSGKCYAYTMQMGVSLLTEYTLSDGKLTEKKIASCSENNDTYTWDGNDVSKDDFWTKHQSYINNYTTPDYTEYTSREDFSTTIKSY